jgi:hypothetical protein
LRYVRRDRWRAMDLPRDARPRHFIFNSFLNITSSWERARVSCAYSNLKMTSLAMAS